LATNDGRRSADDLWPVYHTNRLPLRGTRCGGAALFHGWFDTEYKRGCCCWHTSHSGDKQSIVHTLSYIAITFQAVPSRSRSALVGKHYSRKVFTAQCYACAVYAMALCLSVSVSVSASVTSRCRLIIASPSLPMKNIP